MNAEAPGAIGAGELPSGLKRFLENPQRVRPGERCEMCSEPIPEEHSHVVNLQNRNLMCSCRACYLLFTQTGAAQGRYRAVPERNLYTPVFAVSDEQWDDLQIPVKMAFFFRNSNLDRFVAFYPSPAGSTESLLPLEIWGAVMAANPGFGDLEPDVEALLLNWEPAATECFLVPIDACYELVGRVRLHWRGFSGGEEVWREIEAFCASLRERSRRVETGT